MYIYKYIYVYIRILAIIHTCNQQFRQCASHVLTTGHCINICTYTCRMGPQVTLTGSPIKAGVIAMHRASLSWLIISAKIAFIHASLATTAGLLVISNLGMVPEVWNSHQILNLLTGSGPKLCTFRASKSGLNYNLVSFLCYKDLKEVPWQHARRAEGSRRNYIVPIHIISIYMCVYIHIYTYIYIQI